MREDQALLAAEKNELAIWSHAEIQSQLAFVYLAAAESDAMLVGMASVIRDVWGIRS